MGKANKTSSIRSLYAQVHIAANHLGFESQSDDYRAWLYKLSGVTSCKEMPVAKLRSVVETLRTQRLLESKPTGSKTDRPTDEQWRKMETLARQLDLGSPTDPKFIAWVKKVTKLENPRFLTKSSISSVIAGLERWKAYEKKKSATSS